MVSILIGAERERSASREDPEGRVQRLLKVHPVLIQHMDLLCHREEDDKAIVTVEKYPHPLGLGRGQTFLYIVVPGGDLRVEPLHAPGDVVAAQTTLCTLAIHATIADAHPTEAIILQFYFPVVNSLFVAVQAQHLRTLVQEPLGMWTVFLRYVHCSRDSVVL